MFLLAHLNDTPVDEADPQIAIRPVAHFLSRVIQNDALLPHDAERIFSELVGLFPTKGDKQAFARILLLVAIRIGKQDRGLLVVSSKIQEKVDAITAAIRSYGADKLIVG